MSAAIGGHNETESPDVAALIRATLATSDRRLQQRLRLLCRLGKRRLLRRLLREAALERVFALLTKIAELVIGFLSIFFRRNFSSACSARLL